MSGRTPNNALRLIQIASGPFDTGFTDLSADRSVNKMMSESDSVSEMLSSIGNTDDLLNDLPSDFDLDSSFNEVFTDLSTLIEQNGPDIALDVPTELVEDTQPQTSPSAKGRKRKTPTASPQLADHSSYATKRPKVETVALTPTNSESEDTSTAPPSIKKDNYRKRRDKNNAASKVSRETRKRKYADMENQADQLEKENADLQAKVTELENLTQMMKNALIQKLAQ